jgi:hypothetical protein
MPGFTVEVADALLRGLAIGREGTRVLTVGAVGWQVEFPDQICARARSAAEALEVLADPVQPPPPPPPPHTHTHTQTPLTPHPAPHKPPVPRSDTAPRRWMRCATALGSRLGTCRDTQPPTMQRPAASLRRCLHCSVAASIAASIAASLPPSLRRCLHRCLHRGIAASLPPSRRLRSAGWFRSKAYMREYEELISRLVGPTHTAAPRDTPLARRRAGLSLAHARCRCCALPLATACGWRSLLANVGQPHATCLPVILIAQAAHAPEEQHEELSANLRAVRPALRVHGGAARLRNQDYR